MGEGAVIDMLDAEYTMPGELMLSVRTWRDVAVVEAWPERAQREIDALTTTVAGLVRRVERIEQAVLGSVERRVVLLRWREGVLVRQRAAAMHIKPDAPAVAVGLLRAGSAAWVDEEAAEGVVREVLGE
jgi:hypothetical protein